jgi:Uma2 family endonuclease
MTITAPPSIEIARWNVTEYHQMIASGVLDDRSVELIAGEIVEMPPEGLDHAQGSTDTADYLRSQLGDRALIRDAKPITLPEQDSEPAPDIAVVAPLREVYRTEHHPYPENIFLLIEFSRTSLAKDTQVKRRLYARAGIPDYWLVNLSDRTVLIYREIADGDYQSVQVLATGTIAPLAFPDVQLAIAALL